MTRPCWGAFGSTLPLLAGTPVGERFVQHYRCLLENTHLKALKGVCVMAN